MNPLTIFRIGHTLKLSSNVVCYDGHIFFTLMIYTNIFKKKFLILTRKKSVDYFYTREWFNLIYDSDRKCLHLDPRIIIFPKCTMYRHALINNEKENRYVQNGPLCNDPNTRHAARTKLRHNQMHAFNLQLRSQ